MQQTTLDLAVELSLKDSKTLSQKTLKLMEESGELAKAVLPYEGASGCKHRFPNLDKIMEECADVMLVAFSIAISMGATQDELFRMVGRKANYWKHLVDTEEAAESKALFFETHITVSGVKNWDKFKSDCEWLGVKPIILELDTKDGGVMDDVMTSSHFKGDTVTAAIQSRHLVAKLRAIGYNVVREKIETVPWHPASQHAHLSPSPSKYFEAHVAFAPHTSGVIFNEYLKKHAIHLSKNKMKKGDSAVIMGTVRRSSIDMNATQFEAELNKILQEADDLDLEMVGKPVIEYALFDSNSQHDAEWIA